MRDTSQRTGVQRLLIEWAKWRSVGHGANIGYPTSATFYKMSRMGGWGSKSPVITDELAGQVDVAVARLYLRCGEGDHRHSAIHWSYLGGMSDSAIGRRLKVDRRTAATARLQAESWVDSHIDIEVWDTLV